MMNHEMNLLLAQLDIAVLIAGACGLLVLISMTMVLRMLSGRLIKPIVNWKPHLKDTADGLLQNLRLLIFISGLVLCLLDIGATATILYKGLKLSEVVTLSLQRIPAGLWMTLLAGLIKTCFLIFILRRVLTWILKGLNSLQAQAKNFEGIRSNDESITLTFDLLQHLLVRASWLAAWGTICDWLWLPDELAHVLFLILRVYLITMVGLLIWRALDAIIESLNALSKKYASKRSLMRYYDSLSVLLPILRRSVEYVIYVSVATLVAQQIDFVRQLADWGPRFIRIIGTALIARVLMEVMKLVIEEFLVTRPQLSEKQRKARVTMTPLAMTLLSYLIWFGAGIVMMKEVGVDPFPILAGAGIVGLAVGLGAQNMMNDIVSGFTILFENYYLVGDWIKIGDAEGEVETISITNTRIRDEKGRLHIVRNGDVKGVVNYSKEYTMSVIEVLVSYGTPLENIRQIVIEVGQKLDRDMEQVLNATEFDGIEDFAEMGMLIRTNTKVKPGCHLAVEREIRQNLVEAFERAGIHIPYNRYYTQA